MSDVANRLILSAPLTIKDKVGDADQSITEIVVRRPLGGDLRALDGVKGEVAQSIALLARLTGLTPSDIDNLPYADFSGLTEILERLTSSTAS